MAADHQGFGSMWIQPPPTLFFSVVYNSNNNNKNKNWNFDSKLQSMSKSFITIFMTTQWEGMVIILL